MSLQDWANAFQIFEALVVASSVVLILFQVRQQTKLARAANNNTLFQLYAPFYTELIREREMATLLVEGHEKYDGEFDEVDKFRYRATLAWRITLQENIYYQNQNELLAEEIFRSWEDDFRFFIERRRLSARWPELRRFYHAEFCTYVEQLISEVESGTGNVNTPELSLRDAAERTDE